MPRFTLKLLFLFTAAVAIGSLAIRNSSHPFSTFVLLASCAFATVNLVGAVYLSGANRAFHVGAALFSISTIAVSFGLPFPSQMYLCSPPFGIDEFWRNASLWKLTMHAAAVVLGVFGGFIARAFFLTQPKETTSERKMTGWKTAVIYLLVSCGYVSMSVKLIDLKSNVLATSLQFVTNIALYVALVGAFYRHGASRVFWLCFAGTVWSYLFVETKLSWPYSYFLGPAPYLYHYYNSISCCWVTAQSLSILLLATTIALSARFANEWSRDLSQSPLTYR